MAFLISWYHLLRKTKIEQMKRFIICKSTMFEYLGAIVVSTDLLGSRLVRVLKTSVSEIEMDSKNTVGRIRSGWEKKGASSKD